MNRPRIRERAEELCQTRENTPQASSELQNLCHLLHIIREKTSQFKLFSFDLYERCTCRVYQNTVYSITEVFYITQVGICIQALCVDVIDEACKSHGLWVLFIAVFFSFLRLKEAAAGSISSTTSLTFISCKLAPPIFLAGSQSIFF